MSQPGKTEKVAAIGKNQQRQENGSTASHRKQEAGQVEHDFNDPMPF
jgi:hypothetical protein